MIYNADYYIIYKNKQKQIKFNTKTQEYFIIINNKKCLCDIHFIDEYATIYTNNKIFSTKIF